MGEIVILVNETINFTTNTTTTTSTSSSTPFMTTSTNSEWNQDSINDPLYTAIPMTILYVLILFTGVIGNLLTCIVIVRNRYMHTATNYYLFSLAISDLLLLILGLPQEIYQIWHRYPYVFGEIFCILRGFSSEASTNSSVLTITAFTMERYIAICHPLKAHKMSKLSRAIKLIVIIWLLGFLCAAPIAYQFGIVYEYESDDKKIPQSAACNVKRPVPYLEEHIFALQSLIVFVLPVTWISVLYTLIGVKLRQSSRNYSQSDQTRFRRRPIKRLRSIGSRYSSSFDNSLIEDSSSFQDSITKPQSTANSIYKQKKEANSLITDRSNSQQPEQFRMNSPSECCGTKIFRFKRFWSNDSLNHFVSRQNNPKDQNNRINNDDSDVFDVKNDSKSQNNLNNGDNEHKIDDNTKIKTAPAHHQQPTTKSNLIDINNVTENDDNLLRSILSNSDNSNQIVDDNCIDPIINSATNDKSDSKNRNSKLKKSFNNKNKTDDNNETKTYEDNYDDTNHKNRYRQPPKISKLKSSSTTSNCSTSAGNSLAQRRAVIKMLTAVVVAFFVCFAPFHAQRLMAIYVKNPSNYETLAFILLTYISGVTYYLSATINPSKSLMN
ncbi:26S proteasome non-ATPase regulatory subunit 8-like [Sarcoptes scabiei]|nr:26S proteasome non-ATPase regulatory subunit 8-like [Sarcoptes scabiei]